MEKYWEEVNKEWKKLVEDKYEIDVGNNYVARIDDRIWGTPPSDPEVVNIVTGPTEFSGYEMLTREIRRTILTSDNTGKLIRKARKEHKSSLHRPDTVT